MVQLTLRKILLGAISTIMGALITGYFFSIGEDLWQRTKEGAPILPNLWNPFWFISVPLAIIGILLLAYDVYLRKHKLTPQAEKITIPAPSQKRASWLSKLRRPPIWKGKRRTEFWTTAVIVEITGPIFIYTFYSLFSTSPESARTFSLITAITGIGAIVAFMVLFAWLAIAEHYAIQESKKRLIAQCEATYLNDIKNFDRIKKAVQEESDPDLKTEALGDFQDQLHTLCHHYEWSKVKDKIEAVLEDIIPEKLFDEPHKPHAKKYIQFLAMIIDCFGENVIGIIGKKWPKEIDKFYDDPNYDTTSIYYVLHILLQLRGYSKDYLMKLIDDAVTRWTELRFQTLIGDLGLAFDELKKRDESAHEEIIAYLQRKRRDAKQNKEDIAYNRLSTLFKMANK